MNTEKLVRGTPSMGRVMMNLSRGREAVYHVGLEWAEFRPVSVHDARRALSAMAEMVPPTDVQESTEFFALMNYMTGVVKQ